MDIISEIRLQASRKQKKIVLPEAYDKRTLHAATFLAENKICVPILLGEADKIRSMYKAAELEMHPAIEVIDNYSSDLRERFADNLYEKRKSKGLTADGALKLLDNELYFGASMVNLGLAAGCVAGAVNTTGDVLRAAIQVIGLKKGSSVVSSTFLMSLPDGRVFTYGDCAVVPYPTTEQLASIAVDSATTHEQLTGETPKVAMLSFSTKGSASHERTQMVIDATHLAQEIDPDLLIDGELQFDAALLPSIGQRKAPGSDVAGEANVFIFPNLDAGNIGYKITERLGGAIATGPIIQGLAQPMNDLSRGCSWEDIVNTAAVSVLQAAG